MIAVGPPRAPPLTAPGSFSWLYADGFAPDGRSFVYVSARGLPFLPGAARSAGDARPAAYLVVYEGARTAFYALREEEGPYRLDADGLRVAFDQPIPGGGRARGSLVVDGPAVRGLPDEDGPHRWSPVIAGGRARLALDVDGEALAVEGSGYVDRNESPLGLPALGLARWSWGRRSDARGTRIWYRVEGEQPRQLAVDVAPDGAATLRETPVALEGWRRGRWGVAWPSVVRVEGEAEPPTAIAVDDGPAYVRARLPDGFAEFCEVGRLSCAPMLVQMAVDRRERPSAWLPLFSGRPRDRWTRLWRWWTA